jgi:hypothetical protein
VVMSSTASRSQLLPSRESALVSQLALRSRSAGAASEVPPFTAIGASISSPPYPAGVYCSFPLSLPPHLHLPRARPYLVDRPLRERHLPLDQHTHIHAHHVPPTGPVRRRGGGGVLPAMCRGVRPLGQELSAVSLWLPSASPSTPGRAVSSLC